MDRNKRYFLDFLTSENKEGRAVLFEPFISKYHTETLIWRRGLNLWDTQENYVDTLLSLTERTGADMVFADLRGLSDREKVRLGDAVKRKSKKTDVGFGLICDCRGDIDLAEVSRADVVLIYGEEKSSLPTVRMDGSVEDAVSRGDLGYFLCGQAEEYLEKYGGKIKLLGGLGVDYIQNSGPVSIYSRVADIAKRYPGMWACGSGGCLANSHYLELISLLGAFARIR